LALSRTGAPNVQNVTFISALERLIAAPFREVNDIANSVEDGRVRARLAVFLFARAHLRDKGLAVASACRFSDLTAESSAHVAENLQTHADRLVRRDQPAVSIAIV
jgi:hypothetical protein